MTTALDKTKENNTKFALDSFGKPPNPTNTTVVRLRTTAGEYKLVPPTSGMEKRNE